MWETISFAIYPLKLSSVIPIQFTLLLDVAKGLVMVAITIQSSGLAIGFLLVWGLITKVYVSLFVVVVPSGSFCLGLNLVSGSAHNSKP